MREKEFVEAAHTIGASNLRIMFRHILPNIVGSADCGRDPGHPRLYLHRSLPFLYWSGRQPANAFLGLDDLGWRQVIRTYPNQAIFPALALAITMFAFNFLGDGLRDALDPRLRGTQ